MINPAHRHGYCISNYLRILYLWFGVALELSSLFTNMDLDLKACRCQDGKGLGGLLIPTPCCTLILSSYPISALLPHELIARKLCLALGRSLSSCPLCPQGVLLPTGASRADTFPLSQASPPDILRPHNPEFSLPHAQYPQFPQP
jgi:hypothetical protein